MSTESQIWQSSSEEEEQKFRFILKDRVENSPFYTHLGMSVIGMGAGWSELEMEITERHLNLGGTIHGGAVASIADASAGVAFSTLLDYSKERPTTVELKINYCAAVKEGIIKARGEIIKRGKSISVCESKVYKGDRLVAVMIATLMAVPRR